MATFQGLSQGQSQQQKVSAEQIHKGMLLHANVQTIANVVSTILSENIFFDGIDELESNAESIDDMNPEIDNEYEEEMDDWYNKSAVAEVAQDRKGYMATRPSLSDDLVDQLYSFPLTDKQQEIGLKLIESTDGRGFITSYDKAEEYIVNALSCSKEDVANMIQYLQEEIEPAGMLAKSEKQYFQLQLERLDSGTMADVTLRMLLDHRYQDLINKKLDDLKAFLRVDSMDMVNAAYDALRNLRPVPSLEKGVLIAAKQQREPDFFVTLEAGVYKARLNEKGFPDLKENKHYKATLAAMEINGQDHHPAFAFLRKQNANFNTVKFQLMQRRVDLERVVSAVLNKQKEYIESHDADRLLPLLQKHIAVELKMDPSTISRIVNTKLIQIDGGAPIRLSAFFSKGKVVNSQGEMKGIGEIKDAINKVLLSEDHNNPMTNVELEAALKKEGMAISSNFVKRIVKNMKIADSERRKALYVDGRENNREINKVLEQMGLKPVKDNPAYGMVSTELQQTYKMKF